MLTIDSTKTLANGVEMPRFGLGVYKMTNKEEAVEAMVTALQAGYRAIDTASFYDNEVEVGEAVHQAGVLREDIFIIFSQKTPSSTRGASRWGMNAVLKSRNGTFVCVKLEGKQGGVRHDLQSIPISSLSEQRPTSVDSSNARSLSFCL